MNYSAPARLLDLYLDEAMHVDDELSQLSALLPSAYSSWWNGQRRTPSQLVLVGSRGGSEAEHGRSSCSSVAESDDGQMRMNLDIRQFRPEEVKVKLVENRVVVHAKHEEREDQHGFIKR
jgi:hypothetical protein